MGEIGGSENEGKIRCMPPHSELAALLLTMVLLRLLHRSVGNLF